MTSLVLNSSKKESTDNRFNKVNEITRDEYNGLKALMSNQKAPLPSKVKYEDIYFDEFETGLTYNPRHLFDRAFEYAEKKINKATDAFVAKDSVVQLGPHSWQIKNGFITVDVCLYAKTEYKHSDFDHYSIAIHSVCVSVTSGFDIRNIYHRGEQSTKTFCEVSQFYADLQRVLFE